MGDWQQRAEINGDVVSFRYVNPGIEKSNPEVFVWDIDKTYLDTTIDSLRGVLQVILERALNKQNVPGTKTILLSLAIFERETKGRKYFPIYFITASPPQMEERIYEKFLIDEIRPLGAFFKDNLKNLWPGRFWRLTKQVGYKLQALMQLRTRLHPDVKQICWGDDSESDAIIYNIYSDICARRLDAAEISGILKKLHVTGDQVEQILDLQAQIPVQDPVQKIYINLATDTDPDYYLKFGRRTLATYNAFQVALDLYQDHRLSLLGVYNVAQDMIFNYRFTPEELMVGFDELLRRGVLGTECYDRLKPFLIEKGLMDLNYAPSVSPQREKKVVEGVVFELEGMHEPWIPERIEYLNEYR